jgi:GT2 family glycosyltransferase
MERPRTLGIVIVNWNAGTLLRDCLASLHRARLPAGWSLSQVVVVDNGSSDGSADGLTQHFGPDSAHALPLQVVRNEANRGFAAACNQGAALAGGELLLMLNPDTRLYPDSLAVPIAWLDQPAQRRVGIAGIPLVDDTGSVARSCARFPRASQFALQALGLDRIWPARGHGMKEWAHDGTRQVDQVIGAFFLVRRALWDALGGFDERFFVYFEEVDFSLRARRQGWASAFVTGACAYHVGGGTSRQVKGRRLFYSLRSRLLFAHKHFGLAERLAMGAVTWLLEPWSRCAHLLLTGRADEARAVVEGYRLLLRWRLSGREGP